jgi:hypothetical protein
MSARLEARIESPRASVAVLSVTMLIIPLAFAFGCFLEGDYGIGLPFAPLIFFLGASIVWWQRYQKPAPRWLNPIWMFFFLVIGSTVVGAASLPYFGIDLERHFSGFTSRYDPFRAAVFASTAVLCRFTYRACLEPRAQSLGIVVASAGTTIGVLGLGLWFHAGEIVGVTTIAIGTVVAVVGALIARARLAWLVAVAADKIEGVRVVQIGRGLRGKPAESVPDWTSLPWLYYAEHSEFDERYVLMRTKRADYREGADLPTALFADPGSSVWIGIAARTIAATLFVGVAAGFAFIVLMVPLSFLVRV